MSAFSKTAVVLVALCLLAGRAAAMDPTGQKEPEPGRDPLAQAERDLRDLQLQRAQHMEDEAEVLTRTAEELYPAGRMSAEEAMQRKRHALELLSQAKQIRMELERPREPGPAVGPIAGPPESAPTRLIVVPTKEMDPDRIGAVVEDMEIMSHILQGALREVLGEEYVPRPAGYGPFAPLFDGERQQSLYLQGYGAVFLMKVRFPLLRAPELKRMENQGEPGSLWERTKQELDRPGGMGGGYGTGGPPGMPGMGMGFGAGGGGRGMGRAGDGGSRWNGPACSSSAWRTAVGAARVAPAGTDGL